MQQLTNKDTDSTASPPTVIIKPSKSVALSFKELYDYRELFGFLIWRDITVRYKQTVLGILWAVIQPVLSMVVFTVIFGRFVGVNTDGLPYPIFSYSALVIWTYFADALRRSTDSLVANNSLVTKVYFPRLIMPIASVLSGLFDFCLAFLVLIGLFFYYHIPFRPEIFYLPIFLLLAIMTAFGTGAWLSALNVRYRDIRYIVPFLSQIWLFGSPVVYSATSVPEQWRLLYGINPMAGVVQGFRWALLGQGQPSSIMMTASIISATILFLSGIWYFRRVEKYFADFI